VLDDDERVAGLLQDGHELEAGERPADLQGLDSAVKLAEDGRVVATDVENLEALQVPVAVESLDEHLPGSLQDVEGPGAQRDGGYSSRSMIENRGLQGYEGEQRAVRKCEEARNIFS